MNVMKWWSTMSGKKSGDDGRAAGGGYSKRGKPRPGTGGFRKDRLEGKGPTPPAHMRPGHPAQRAAAKAAARPGGRAAAGPAAGRAGGRRPRPSGVRAREPGRPGQRRGAGDGRRP